MEIFSAVAGSTYGVRIIFITKTSIYSCYTAINFPRGVRDSFFQMPCFSNTIYPRQCTHGKTSQNWHLQLDFLILDFPMTFICLLLGYFPCSCECPATKMVILQGH